MVTPETTQSPLAAGELHMDNDFGHLLVRIRRREGLTQEEFAEKFQYSVSHIRKLESGERRPSAHFMDALSDQFGLLLEEGQQLEAAAKGSLVDKGPKKGGLPPPAHQVASAFSEVVRMVGDALPIAKSWIYALVTLLTLLLFGLTCLVVAVAFQTIRGIVAPSSSPAVVARLTKPGGVWLSPKNAQHFQTALRFAVRAYPTNAGDPAIKFVNITVSWAGRPGPWLVVCQPHHAQSLQSFSDVYTCLWNPKKRHLNVPTGKLNVSFDVYDQAGNINFAPEGTRIVYYTSPH